MASSRLARPRQLSPRAGRLSIAAGAIGMAWTSTLITPRCNHEVYASECHNLNVAARAWPRRPLFSSTACFGVVGVTDPFGEGLAEETEGAVSAW